MRQDLNKLSGVRTMGTYLNAPHTRALLRRMSDEDVPTRIGMRASVPHYRAWTVRNLSPLKRWLRAQVGRLWDDVHSELCSQFDVRNETQRHVLDHLLYQVDTNVVMNSAGFPEVRGALFGCVRVNGLYVDPDTKKLAYSDLTAEKARQRKLREAERQKVIRDTEVRVTPTLHLRMLNNLWFWVELAPITAPVKRKLSPDYVRDGVVIVEGYYGIDPATICRDVLSGQEFFSVPKDRWSVRDSMAMYGLPAHYAKRKWQASHEDIKRYVKAAQLAA